MSFQTSHRRTRAGFTLLELMIVVAIIGTFASLASVSLGGWRNSTRQRDAARELLNYIEVTQAHTMRDRVARLLTFTKPAAPGGQVQRLVGMNSHCLKTPWAGAPADGPPLNFATMQAGGGATLDLTPMLGGVATIPVGLCFEPTGRTYFRNAAGVFRMQDDLLVAEVRRLIGAVPSGIPRNVLVEPGGRARLQR